MVTPIGDSNGSFFPPFRLVYFRFSKSKIWTTFCPGSVTSSLPRLSVVTPNGRTSRGTSSAWPATTSSSLPQTDLGLVYLRTESIALT